jgi:hypothetical protein
MSEISKMNHVVIAQGTWGRGRDYAEACANAGIESKAFKSKHWYYIFKNNNWDLDDFGRMEYNDEDLLFMSTIMPQDDEGDKRLNEMFGW